MSIIFSLIVNPRLKKISLHINEIRIPLIQEHHTIKSHVMENCNNFARKIKLFLYSADQKNPNVLYQIYN